MDAPPRRGIDSSRPYLESPPTSPMAASFSRQMPPGDPDTCRICRGEGAPGEPLFYPCKCSGSIKFVHQDCLMEWLSHSQKKHCELCKTPFRFTKLYSPSMPKSLPVHVFVSHMGKHVLRQMVHWLRAAVVVMVWLFWLPYMMRSIWAFYFWISDEGFVRPTVEAALDAARLPEWMVNGPFPDTCPASPLLALPITSIAAVTGSDIFSGQDTWATVANKDPISTALINMVATALRKVLSTNMTRLLDQYALTVASGNGPRPSLLSNVEWLRNLTRSPILNYGIVVVLEGQIITVSVIICFILIILVRDYVVQQQPEINMRAAFGGQVVDEPNEPEEEEQGDDRFINEREGFDPHAWRDPADFEHDDREIELLRELADDAAAQQLEEMLATPSSSGGAPSENGIEDEVRPGTPAEFDEPELLNEIVGRRRAAGEGSMRAQFYGLDTALNADTLPVVLDDNQTTRATAEEFIELQREAGGNARRFLQLVQEHGLDERMMQVWIANTNAALQKEGNGEGSSSALNIDGPADEELIRSLGEPVRVGQADDVDYTSDQEEVPDSALRGKGKTSESSFNEGDIEWDESVVSPTTSRRGSALDNRPIQPSRLQYGGNWSFGSLVDEVAEAEARDNVPLEDAPLPNRIDVANRIGVPNRIDATVDELMQGQLLLPAPRVINDDDTANNDDNQPNDVEEPHVDHEEIPQGLLGRVANFVFADIEHVNIPNEPVVEPEVVVEEVADDVEAVGAENPAEEGEEAEGPDAADIEDLEDFEGVMELLGMRGPIVGLVQNSLFCAVLVSLTIFLCVFVPYNIGRITLWLVANPASLVRAMFELSKFVQDVVVLATGFFSWMVFGLVNAGCYLFGARDTIVMRITVQSLELTIGAARSIIDGVVSDLSSSASDIRNFSALSHVALIDIKNVLAAVFSVTARGVVLIGSGRVLDQGPAILAALSDTWTAVQSTVVAIPGFLLDPSAWVIPGAALRAKLPPPELAMWSSNDRLLAILCGYLTLALLAMFYLRRGAPMTSSPIGQQWEASLVDLIHQASGVMKVIVVISIEMLIFPLYCGLLLDAALLPLFEGATIKSRMAFTCNYPLTSVFVHWFVGTGYMFHFALFVSMCRKVMRRGVLYFIRDPDDPEFHPVRDVLERSLVAQLRKILFSAFVYGGLVIVCLGGVVWGLWYSVPSLLPIHYSSDEPILEFPIDLMFYNFAMPVAVRYFKPSDSLHSMYTWWFRQCARSLRLTWFLFGNRRVDEEGTLVLAPDSEYRQLPWWRTLFLELHDNKVVPLRWSTVLDGANESPSAPIGQGEFVESTTVKRRLEQSGELVPSGRLVRTPASDQIKIPRGLKVFRHATDVEDAAAKGTVDLLPPATFSSDTYQLAYIPPHFGFRIFLFILFIWLFAAATGVGLTIVPLVFGRWMFCAVMPEHIRTNDIYAFSIGICVLGTLAYGLVHVRTVVLGVRNWVVAVVASWVSRNAPARLGVGVLTVARLTYAYTALVVLLPLVTAAIMELYIILPFRTAVQALVNNGHALDAIVDGRQQTVRIIQSWTLGVIYLKLGSRVVMEWHEETRLAMAIRAVMRRGILEPDIGVLTRVFVLPGLTVGGVAILGPLVATHTLLSHGYLAAYSSNPTLMVLVYRIAYPAAALGVVGAWFNWRAVAVFNRWTVRIKDEAYLIGERLHNFGVASASPLARTEWRGNRLRGGV